MTAVSVRQARDAFDGRAWTSAYEQLSAAGRDAPLGPVDLERLAVAAYLTGRDAESADAWAAAHRALLDRGDPERAARCAFWLAFQLLNAGEAARGGGWLARAQRLLEQGHDDCVEQGYVLAPMALQTLYGGDPETAAGMFARAGEIGARHAEPDLMTLGHLGQGQALLRMARWGEATTHLDEAMVAVTAGEVSPVVSGLVYCAVIMACQETFDLRRAGEWTAALSHWCEAQPDLVPYRGQCLVHRAEIMHLHGAWPDAREEARRATRRLSEPPGQPALGMALYEEAELQRLHGEFEDAESGYRQARLYGRRPQPGLALLRLAQGRLDVAEAGLRLALDEAGDRLSRARMLPAYVEVALEADDVPGARSAADELAALATEIPAVFLDAVSAQAAGAVLLAEGEPRAALTSLRQAWTSWQEVDAPYDAARTRVLMSRAYRDLGDEDGAEMELDAARWVFQQLGALPDLARVERLSARARPQPAAGLTAREVEVLRLVATGMTNRAIADVLVISEKTVARHVSNIFTKLDVSSRTAATAFAYEHGLA